jgi:hypothetical protein
MVPTESALKGRPMRNEVGLGAEGHCQLGRGVARAPLPREMLGDTHPHSVAPCRAIFILLTDPGAQALGYNLEPLRGTYD